MPKNNVYIALGNGLGMLHNASEGAVEQLDIPGKRVGASNKLVKFAAVKLEAGPKKIPVGVVEYHAGSGGSEADETQREHERDHLGQEVIPAVLVEGCKKVLFCADFNVSGYKVKKESKDKPFADRTGADYEIDRSALEKIAKGLMSGDKKVRLVAVKTPANIIEKQRLAGYIDLNQQGAKGGDIDEDSKTMSFEFEAYDGPLSKEALEKEANELIASLKVPESVRVLHFGTPPNEGGPKHGSDHEDPVPAAVKPDKEDAELTVTVGTHALMGTAGVTGVRPPSEVFKEELTDANMKLIFDKTRKLHEELKKALFRENPALENQQVKIGKNTDKTDKMANVADLDYCNFVKWMHGDRAVSGLLLANDGALIKQVLVAWVDSEEYKKANALLIIPKLTTPEEIDALVVQIVSIKKDIVNIISEKGIDAQVSAGYPPMLGQNPRQAQLFAAVMEKAPTFTFTENDEMTKRDVESRSLKKRGHLNAKKDMRDVTEARDLIAYVLGEKGADALPKIFKEYTEAFELENALKELREKALLIAVQEIYPQISKISDMTDFQAQALSKVALQADNKNIACALAASDMIRPYVLKDIIKHIKDNALTSTDIAIIAGIPAIQAAVARQIISTILSPTGLKLSSEMVARVPNIATELCKELINGMSATPPLYGSVTPSLLKNSVIQTEMLRLLLEESSIAVGLKDEAASKEALEQAVTRINLVIGNNPAMFNKLALAFSDIEEAKVREALLKNKAFAEHMKNDLLVRAKKYGALAGSDALIVKQYAKELFELAINPKTKWNTVQALVSNPTIEAMVLKQLRGKSAENYDVAEKAIAKLENIEKAMKDADKKAAEAKAKEDKVAKPEVKEAADRMIVSPPKEAAPAADYVQQDQPHPKTPRTTLDQHIRDSQHRTTLERSSEAERAKNDREREERAASFRATEAGKAIGLAGKELLGVMGALEEKNRAYMNERALGKESRKEGKMLMGYRMTANTVDIENATTYRVLALKALNERLFKAISDMNQDEVVKIEREFKQMIRVDLLADEAAHGKLSTSGRVRKMLNETLDGVNKLEASRDMFVKNSLNERAQQDQAIMLHMCDIIIKHAEKMVSKEDKSQFENTKQALTKLGTDEEVKNYKEKMFPGMDIMLRLVKDDPNAKQALEKARTKLEAPEPRASGRLKG